VIPDGTGTNWPSGAEAGDYYLQTTTGDVYLLTIV
jgi:hypothetical protein